MFLFSLISPYSLTIQSLSEMVAFRSFLSRDLQLDICPQPPITVGQGNNSSYLAGITVCMISPPPLTKQQGLLPALPRKLGLILDRQLLCEAHTAAKSSSCRYASCKNLSNQTVSQHEALTSSSFRIVLTLFHLVENFFSSFVCILCVCVCYGHWGSSFMTDRNQLL